VAAHLLQEEGYEVHGVFLDFWKSSGGDDDFQSAKKMAKSLGISLERLDCRDEFKRKIVDEFIHDYKRGVTPNPCVICNAEMKFDALIREAGKRGVKMVATGHYSRLRKFTVNSSQLTESVNCKLSTAYCLRVAKDKLKDQSYFLYRLKEEQLRRIIFPLGNYLKSEVKDIARKLKLEVVEKKESQDVCFIPRNEINEFLKKYIKDNPGNIIDTSGKTLGTHSGLHFYTIGQRRGIDIGGDGPYYVVEKDNKNNLLIVSNKGIFSKKSFFINKTNWIYKNIASPLKFKVKIRYKSVPVYAKIKRSKEGNDFYEIKLRESQRSITSGQSAVFYDRNCVIGGGIIV
jgi:tRNA-specific 2-thiouridylase